MKNIILQHWVGELGELEIESSRNIKRYADYCGAEYHLLRGNIFDSRLSPQSQKMCMLSPEFDDYDTVVMLDTDMFTRKGMTKNIFTDETGIGRHYGIQTHLIKQIKRRFPLLADPNYCYWGGSFYRLGKSDRIRLRQNMDINEMSKFNGNFNDEGIMHRLAVLSEYKNERRYYLDGQKWNYSSFDEGIEDANIIHIRPKVTPTGPKRPKLDNYKSLVKIGLI